MSQIVGNSESVSKRKGIISCGFVCCVHNTMGRTGLPFLPLLPLPISPSRALDKATGEDCVDEELAEESRDLLTSED